MDKEKNQVAVGKAKMACEEWRFSRQGSVCQIDKKASVSGEGSANQVSQKGKEMRKNDSAMLESTIKRNK